MKLSKAKKLFKAGEIQICQGLDNIKAARKIHRYIDRMENGHSRYIVGEAAVLTRSMPFTDIGFVNLSDIKPSKKKTLKKKAKELKQDLIEAHEVIDKLEIQLNYLKTILSNSSVTSAMATKLMFESRMADLENELKAK